MGCVATKQFIPDERIPGQGKSVLTTASKLKLTQYHLDGFFYHFKKLDMNNDDTLEIEEFLIVNDIQSKHFGELVFRTFDSDNNGSIDFEEYVIAMWNFCTLDRVSLITFTFRLFDVDNSGKLSKTEFQGILNIIHGYKQTDRLTVALKKLENQKSVTLYQFIGFARELPVLLFPAFEIQERLQVSLFGRTRWSRLTDYRKKVFGSKTVFEILGQKDKYVDKAIESMIMHVPDDYRNSVLSVAQEMRKKSLGVASIASSMSDSGSRGPGNAPTAAGAVSKKSQSSSIRSSLNSIRESPSNKTGGSGPSRKTSQHSISSYYEEDEDEADGDDFNPQSSELKLNTLLNARNLAAYDTNNNNNNNTNISFKRESSFNSQASSSSLGSKSKTATFGPSSHSHPSPSPSKHRIRINTDDSPGQTAIRKTFEPSSPVPDELISSNASARKSDPNIAMSPSRMSPVPGQIVLSRDKIITPSLQGTPISDLMRSSGKNSAISFHEKMFGSMTLPSSHTPEKLKQTSFTASNIDGSQNINGVGNLNEKLRIGDNYLDDDSDDESYKNYGSIFADSTVSTINNQRAAYVRNQVTVRTTKKTEAILLATTKQQQQQQQIVHSVLTRKNKKKSDKGENKKLKRKQSKDDSELRLMTQEFRRNIDATYSVGTASTDAISSTGTSPTYNDNTHHNFRPPLSARVTSTTSATFTNNTYNGINNVDEDSTGPSSHYKTSAAQFHNNASNLLSWNQNTQETDILASTMSFKPMNTNDTNESNKLANNYNIPYDETTQLPQMPNLEIISQIPTKKKKKKRNSSRIKKEIDYEFFEQEGREDSFANSSNSNSREVSQWSESQNSQYLDADANMNKSTSTESDGYRILCDAELLITDLKVKSKKKKKKKSSFPTVPPLSAIIITSGDTTNSSSRESTSRPKSRESSSRGSSARVPSRENSLRSTPIPSTQSLPPASGLNIKIPNSIAEKMAHTHQSSSGTNSARSTSSNTSNVVMDSARGMINKLSPAPREKIAPMPLPQQSQATTSILQWDL